jgi:LacI family transcriptional regulator
MANERITVKEIARLAGVSIGTVDRVLHDRGGVSPATKGRVDDIIESLGYEPNLIARQLSLNRSYCFRAALPRAGQDSGYWALCLSGIRRAGSDLAPYGVELRIDEFDRYDRVAYRALLEDLVADPGDGLLIAPVLPEELLAALPRLGQAGDVEATPYAFLDSEVPGTSPVAVVGQDPFRGGYLAGRLMSLLAPATASLPARDSSPLVAVSAHAGDRHIRRRIEGFEAFFEGSRRIEVAECAELETERDCDTFLGGLFGGRRDIAGVLVANSSGHLVGEWLESRASKRGCPVLSWDLVPANARSLREGRLDCVVSQRPAEQGREVVERLFKAVVRGEPDSGPASIPLEVYFKENLPDGE